MLGYFYEIRSMMTSSFVPLKLLYELNSVSMQKKDHENVRFKAGNPECLNAHAIT